MTASEGQVILDAIKRNAPGWFERMRVEQAKKREMLSRCIDIACRSDNEGYQDEINGVYNASPFRLSEPDLILLNYICLIKHKEHINDGIVKDDEQIRKWLTVLARYIDGDSPINSLLDACSRQILNQYRIKNKVGRPKGRGKRTFVYEGQEYNTIQECADQHSISKQGMYKKLKKLQIIKNQED